MPLNDCQTNTVCTLRCLVYALLTLPLGITYAVLLISGLALGLALLPLGVGRPILLTTFELARDMAASERHLLHALLGVRVPAAGTSPAADPNTAKLRAYLTDAATWRVLLYLLFKLPLGVLSFALTASLFGLALVLLAAPFARSSAPLNLGFAYVTTDSAAALCALLGALLLPLTLAAVRLLACLWASLGLLLLSVEKPKRTPERTVVIITGE